MNQPPQEQTTQTSRNLSSPPFPSHIVSDEAIDCSGRKRSENSENGSGESMCARLRSLPLNCCLGGDSNPNKIISPELAQLQHASLKGTIRPRKFLSQISSIHTHPSSKSDFLERESSKKTSKTNQNKADQNDLKDERTNTRETSKTKPIFLVQKRLFLSLKMRTLLFWALPINVHHVQRDYKLIRSR